MKAPSFLYISALLFGTAFAPDASAVDLFWDADGNTPGATGGTGTWNTSSALWRNGNTAGPLQNYDNTTPSAVIARFGGTAGTVTLSGTLNAAGITFDSSGYLLTGGTLNLAPSAGAFVYTTNGGTNTIDSTVTSASGTSIIKTGAGTLVINTGGGGTGTSPNFYTVTGGTLNSSTGIFNSILAMPAGNRLGVQAASPTTVLTLDAGTFQVTSATGNALAANRRVQVNAAGGSIVDFGSNNFYDAPIINNAGLTSSLYLSNGSGSTQFRGVISGTGSVTWMGGDTASFQASNTYSGGTFIAGGTLSIGELVGNSLIEGSNTGLGSGNVNVSSGAQLVFAGNNLSIANNITLNGAATVNGRQGALMGGFQDSASANTLSGTLTLAGTGDRTVSTFWSDKSLNLTGKVTGTGTLRVVNASSSSSNGGSIIILSNATNDYSGGTIVDAGGNGSTQTLRLGASNVIPDGAGKGNVTVEGRLELNGFNETINGISGGFGGIVSLSSGNVLAIGNNDAIGDFSGVFTGAGNLTKIGTGTQILRGTNDYSGITTISSGTLQVSVNGTTATLGSGNVINNSALAFQRQNEITVNNLISGTGTVSQIGSGTLVLTAANTYTGATSVSSGTLRLTGSLANTAISVASGASFSPTVTTSAGLGSGSAGASLTLNSGAILDMTSAGAGTINTFTLNPSANTFSGQALSLAGANLRFDLNGSTADRLQVNSGTATVSGVNDIRLNTGGSLTPGAYTLISNAAGGLTGNFQFDGGSSLSVPAQSQIKNIGGTYYRLTLQNSGTAQQVVVSAAPSNVINIMPLGSSITEGVSSEGNTYAGGGYRSQLYQSLVNDGRFTPHYVGSQTVLDAKSTTAYNVLSGANELNHEGHSGYTTTQILKNLNANGGDGGNNGGFWLAPGNGVNPDYVTLSIGGNDYGANSAETTGPLNRTDAIVSQVASLRPDAQIILSNLFYRTQNVGGVIVGDLQNAYYNPGVPKVVFNHVLAGHHVSFSDAYSAVTPGNNTSTILDTIHPTTVGYNAFASSWYDALANGLAYWTGAQGTQWNTVAGGNTNFAQNYQRTTPRQTALGAATDVHFNGNAAPLGTTLGQDIAVRSVNFAAGATGAVTIGGANTLTLGEGGITVQAGTGAHTISANIVLGADQTWGNVSSNPLTVSGRISGSHSLNIVGSSTVQLPGTLSGGIYTTTTQTVSGTGAIVLSGANTYTGATTVSSGTLGIAPGGSIGGGATPTAVSIGASGTLVNNGSVTGNTLVNTGGTLRGNGSYTGDITVLAGGTHKIGNSPGRTVQVGNYSNAGLVSFEVQGITANVFTLAPGTGRDPASILSTASNRFALNDPGANGFNNDPVNPSAAYDPAIGGPGGTFVHSSMEVNGTFTVTGTLEVVFTSLGYTPADLRLGDVFDLLDVTGATSAFAPGFYRGNGDETASGYALPDISGTGLLFNTSLLQSQGLLVVVPEPSRALFLLLAGASLLAGRRRPKTRA